MNQPQWADSLRNLYDSVVDEPIPDSFKDLLDQFDEPKKDGPKQDGGDAT
ncbi:NepR family anti-sigma factor [Alteriqipengyuania lutimaris]|nr:NepR family anti-sigma factor [Alteriqipengyuania lutimaris]